MLKLAPRGWAFAGTAPIDAYAAALDLLAGDDVDGADEVLVEAWAKQARILPVEVRRLSRLHEGTNENLIERARLLDTAWRLHQAGEYAAVIPLLFAQVDGLVIDSTGGRQFFTSRNRATLVDDGTLAGLQESLPVVRKYFDRVQDETGATGGISRHGVVHGRELAYDSEVNAARAWSLLAAAIDFSAPSIERAALAARSQYLTKWAGSDAVDERGRRRDDRGFTEAHELLEKVEGAQRLTFTTDSRYRRKPLAHPSQDFTSVDIEVTADGQAWWAWTTTPSGWCFGRAGSRDQVWVFDGSSPPAAGPGDGEAWVEEDGGALPPNWRDGSAEVAP
ncbi:MAG: hypothetical protein KDB10_18020 [Acidimicrobiales bacterium]|nr:hypothetical protein [Acidimicrobiales bacterium]